MLNTAPAEMATMFPVSIGISSPVFLTNVSADNPPGYVLANDNQEIMPTAQPPTTPQMTPAAVARAQVTDLKYFHEKYF